ncbi:uncharacterized protein B0J16DRAFT_367484 [Fusarium flagelliforme]|uniref:Small secreted protein n=1 Tax=Fusarium flagelliforme TaxID=2675880 RepID=A0A395N6E0_9HYPO|nr:uncharacterized protein B0J16DRAFT_367484 [Fusarium flagelliforme]KAH7198393.1 hypothetical protein B0J16DRAFT_367484 [Fusarium flagelliforme]RFN55209.1 small secreted protein [Fusarium flagelliforme]
MHYTTLLTTVLSLSLTASVSATAISPRALRKANEFVSENCAQGTASYEHHGNFNIDVTMDDTSNSVYLASGPWYFYGGKSSNGGLCTGDVLGSWENDTDNPCVNLNRRGDDGRRIQCVRWNNMHP